ncbi:YitT family protein [Paenibacillus glacialis]|uniref:DUF2179 domain-containing protein n=1 Tax=Paenibacillus glacialis TaxID=494026 RepID=A0A168N350_9BACL|nr:YitT family protein [Paenibacillus glacialis]OAB45335.1 hypothetical protein PGLA_03540 [Paenibacillus glacialis]
MEPTQSYERREFKRLCTRMLFVVIGSVLASVGLELFLIPNQIIVGGMTGISALFAHITEMRLGLFLLLLNVPFIGMNYRHIRREFVILTVLGLIVFSLSAIFLHHTPALIKHPLSAAMIGGASLGLGLGTVVRYGGALDTLELAERSHWRNGLPVDNIIMLINCMVLTSAGFIFGWDQAMYSVIAYLLAYEMIHVTIRGFALYRTMYVQSIRDDEIKQVLGLSLGLTNISADTQVEDANHEQAEMNSDLGNNKEVAKPLVYKVHIAEKARFRVLVRSIDPEADISSYDTRTAPNYYNRN